MGRLQRATLHLVASICVLFSSGLMVKGIKNSPVVEYSPLDQGLRASTTDFYTVQATIDADASVRSSYSTLVSFQGKPTGGGAFTTICLIDITSCVNNTMLPCYCVVDNGNTFEILAKGTADITYSDSVARFLWVNTTNSSPPQYSGDIGLPTIYNVNNSKVELKVNNERCNIGTCEFLLDQSNTVSVTCLEPLPCWVKLSVNGTEVISQSTVSQTVGPTDEQVLVEIFLSLGVNGMFYLRNAFDILIVAPSGETGFAGWKIALIIICILLIMAIIGVVVWWCVRKRKPPCKIDVLGTRPYVLAPEDTLEKLEKEVKSTFNIKSAQFVYKNEKQQNKKQKAKDLMPGSKGKIKFPVTVYAEENGSNRCEIKDLIGVITIQKFMFPMDGSVSDLEHSVKERMEKEVSLRSLQLEYHNKKVTEATLLKDLIKDIKNTDNRIEVTVIIHNEKDGCTLCEITHLEAERKLAPIRQTTNSQTVNEVPEESPKRKKKKKNKTNIEKTANHDLQSDSDRHRQGTGDMELQDSRKNMEELNTNLSCTDNGNNKVRPLPAPKTNNDPHKSNASKFLNEPRPLPPRSKFV